MNKLLYILLLSFGFGAIFQVPEDYSTIQSGIDAAGDGDTVLVSQGVYFENLIIEKSITLSSYAIYDDLSEWVGNFGEYYVTNDNISNTIINGSNNTNGDIFQSTILINSPEDGCIEPTIFGFTITGGSGTKVVIETEEEDIVERHGGGILTNNALPIINYNFIKNNGGDIQEGGGVGFDSGVDFSVNILNIKGHNLRCTGDADLSYNFYRDNDALYGNTLSTEGFEGSLDMSNSIYDVYNCPEQEVTPVWVDIEEDVEVDFQYSAGDLCSITEDVWVSPDGNDYLNTGVTPESAFRTIKVALELIAPQDDDPVTIFLTEGTFAPSITGESFPIIMVSNVNLIGEGEEVTILDAQQSGKVVKIEDCDNNIISDFTVTGGIIMPDPELVYNGSGAGILLHNSDVNLTNITITNNTSSGSGGGIFIQYSNSILSNITITNNTAEFTGGGVYISYCSPKLTNLIISNNSISDTYAYNGGGAGGIAFYESNSMMINSTISNNINRGIYCTFSNITLKNVIVANNTGFGIFNIGDGITLYDTNLTLNHVTIADNYGSAIDLPSGNNSSNITIKNSIIWNNDQGTIPSHIVNGVELIISYSNIQGGWVGEGNIDSDPLFNEDYTLQESSPCIDSGDPSLWYEDLDGTRANMGATSGPFVLTNFKNYDFGNAGDLGSSTQFTLYNFRQTPIIISNVTFGTTSFTTDASFPMTIAPLETGIVGITANNNILGSVEDEMVIISDDLAEGLWVSLSAIGVDGNILSGNLSGTYPLATYRISGDLTIADGDTAYLQAGTEFLFDGQYNFNIYGTLKAIGTVSDSIIFDNYSDDKWRGFTLENASDETTFEYVRISGAKKYEGGGMYLSQTNPILAHMNISNNTAEYSGGGMYVFSSNPTLSDVIISNNTAVFGGGMYLFQSNPILAQINISNNTAELNGGGILIEYSGSIISNTTISNNTAGSGDNTAGSGGGMYLFQSNPILNYITISNNRSSEGGGMFISGMARNYYKDDETKYLWDSTPVIKNSIIWENFMWDYSTSTYSTSTYSINSEGAWTNTDVIVSYSNIQGGWVGEGNIDSEPQFTDPDNGDYTLQSGSPCIDNGDILDDEEYCGSNVDMGAYEYCGEECGAELADVSGDGQINILDLVQIANYILEVSIPQFECAADFNEDGQVNILDLVQIANYILNN